jgi:acyl dehydratase
MRQPVILDSFDQLVVGEAFDFGSLVMTEAAILDFARQFDPQPFHLDPEAAKASVFGGLIASGLHTQSACFGHVIRSGIFAKVSMGGSGLEVSWPAPVRPGDEIGVTLRIEETTPSRSKPDRGIVKHRITGRRVADGQVVIEIRGTMFMRR